MRVFRTSRRVLCLLTLICIAARAPSVLADHDDEAPPFGLFDFSSVFAGVSNGAENASFPNLSSNFTVHEPDFAGFIEAARALAFRVFKVQGWQQGIFIIEAAARTMLF